MEPIIQWDKIIGHRNREFCCHKTACNSVATGSVCGPPRPPILTLAARGGLGAEPGGGAGLSQGVIIRPRRASPPRRLIRPEEVAL